MAEVTIVYWRDIPAQVIVGLLDHLKSGRQFAAPANRLGPVDPPPVPLPR